MDRQRTPANFNPVVVQPEQEPQTAGELIRFWRRGRGLSQLELSLDANVSTKHLSFVETFVPMDERSAARLGELSREARP